MAPAYAVWHTRHTDTATDTVGVLYEEYCIIREIVNFISTKKVLHSKRRRTSRCWLLFSTVLVTLLRQMISATAYPIREIAAPLPFRPGAGFMGLGRRRDFFQMNREHHGLSYPSIVCTAVDMIPYSVIH